MSLTDPVKVVLLGEPVPWARTRINKAGALFTPARQRNNSAALRLAAQQAMNGRAPFNCPIRLDLQVEFLIPASWSRRKREAALRGEIRPGKRPDLSNLCKTGRGRIQHGGLQGRRADRRIWTLAQSLQQSAEARCDGPPGMSGQCRCLWCDRLFMPRRGGGSRQVFCQADHRIAFHSAARRWAERAVASGTLSITELRNGAAAACTLVSDGGSANQVFRALSHTALLSRVIKARV